MPLTLQFGPWAPDLKDVPVQVPDTQGPLPVPCADCLNVYYANGAYKSIPSLAVGSIDGNPVAALSAQALQAISYYDNVEQQETIFVGTQTGIQQLGANGMWSTVPFLTNQSAAIVGQSIGFAIGNLGNTDALRQSKISYAAGTITSSNTGTSIVAGFELLSQGPPRNVLIGVGQGLVGSQVLQSSPPCGGHA